MNDTSSEEESDFSDSEIQEYAEKPYEQLIDGTFKVRGPNGTLRCPFCEKQDYKYKDLFQHASGVAKGSSNRTARQKANHFALSKYLQDFLANEVDRSELPVASKPVIQAEKKDEELFVWPWTGILVNIMGQRDGSGFPDSAHWMKEFSKLKPSEVLTFWNGTDPASEAIISFGADWNGFVNGAEFEKGFDVNGFGKKGWREAQRTGLGQNVFGWYAREEDYRSPGAIGEYLREKGQLRTISHVIKEESQSRVIVVAELADKIEATNELITQLNYHYNEETMLLNSVLRKKDMLQNKFAEDSKRVQDMGRQNVLRILDEQDRLSIELENNKKMIDLWSKELNKREAQTEREREKLEEEKKKNESSNNSHEAASAEQMKSDESMCRLVEEHKREKEESLKEILKLETELDEKLKLQLDIEELKGKIEVMKHLENQDDEAVQAKMKEMEESLTDKVDSLEHMEALNQTLLTKERETNDELQEARKRLIEGVENLLVGPGDYGIKRMGEIDQKPFIEMCKKRFPPGEADIEATTMCSSWQEKLKDPNWHPFRMERIDDNNHKKILDEDDEDLKNLREKWGEEIHNAVVVALQEIEESNPSGRYSVKALWSFKDGREATLKEFIAFCMSRMKSIKRKRVR